MSARPARTDEPAYPSHGTMGEVVQTGMTLREAFAMAAMNGHIGCFAFKDRTAENIAKLSVECADALIAELAKVKP